MLRRESTYRQLAPAIYIYALEPRRHSTEDPPLYRSGAQGLLILSTDWVKGSLSTDGVKGHSIQGPPALFSRPT